MYEFSLYVLDIAMNSVRAGATEIRITLREESEWLYFNVSDNGCGYVPSDCASGSFGLKIVESTVRDKLRGHLRISSDSSGTRVSFDFKTE